jgi:hypothetical protein
VQDARKASWQLTSVRVGIARIARDLIASRVSLALHHIFPCCRRRFSFLHSCAVARLTVSLVSKVIRLNQFKHLRLITVGKIPLNISPIITISEAGENHDKLNGLSQLDRELLVNRLKFFHKDLRRPLSREQRDDQASQRREFDQDHVKTLFNPKRDGIWYLQSLSPSNLQSSKFARLNSQ